MAGVRFRRSWRLLVLPRGFAADVQAPGDGGGDYVCGSWLYFVYNATLPKKSGFLHFLYVEIEITRNMVTIENS